MQHRAPRATDCERCWNYNFNEESGCFECRMDLDEDEMGRFMTGTVWQCPYFRFNDEYEVVRKQN